ncbi:nucleotidyltransferase family protein [Planctomycetota bacterium]
MIDVTPAEMKAILGILQEYLPGREVRGFGSRVTGTAKSYSDLDLVIMGDEEVDLKVMAMLKDAFAESNLPYRIDIIQWCQTGDEFKDVITSQLQSLGLHNNN